MPHFEALLPILVTISTLIAMISLRNSDVGTRARNCRAELLYQVDALLPKIDRSAPLTSTEIDDWDEAMERGRRRKENLRAQIRHFESRYRLLSLAYILLILAMAGLGLYGTSSFFIPISGRLAGAILDLGLLMFVAGIVLMVWEAFVGSRTLELNSKD